MVKKGREIHPRLPKAWSSQDRDGPTNKREWGDRYITAAPRKKNQQDFPAIEKRASGRGFSKIIKNKVDKKNLWCYLSLRIFASSNL